MTTTDKTSEGMATTTRMRVYLTGMMDRTEYVPAVTARALERRGFVICGNAVPVTLVGRGGLVSAKLTDSGRVEAIRLLREEHAARLARGERSERIPRLLAASGVAVALDSIREGHAEALVLATLRGES